jgi:ATP-dependent helicase/nuclease subunit A
MSEVLDKTNPQQRAADPTLSAFVTANAGSGKTKTLIDRVARLLLAGAKPEAILCVTYTKAAAAEMQRRLYGVLGGWSVLPDAALRDALAELEQRDARAYDDARLSEARALFARALETPGGLKIQTIHAFCEKLLRRFPLEAGVSPGFRVMDDAAAAFASAEARRAVARLAMGGLGDVADAYARFSVALDHQSFQKMFADFESRRGEIARFLDQAGGFEGAVAWAWQACELPMGFGPEQVEAEALAHWERAAWIRAADLLAGGGKRDQDYAGKLRRAAADPEASLFQLLGALFTSGGEGKEVEHYATTKTLNAHPNVRTFLLAEQSRLLTARNRMRSALVAQDTIDALTLAAAYLAAYENEKRFSGALDFSDLVEKTCALLKSRPAAAWVLYKLDGGIDHILVDEAQDTAPDQWDIVDALTDEFFSGEGRARPGPLARNMFVVGDEKQSIYSFQGARPELLIRKFEFHRDRATGAGFKFERVDLLTSWRSTPQVLSFVDAVFAPEHLAKAIQPRVEPEAVLHRPVRKDHAGCVDVWPLFFEEKGAEREAWDAPLDAETEQSANRRLARQIACEIRDTLDRGDAVYDAKLKDWRPAHAGDVLILVRRRKVLFEEILRALKHEGIPVAGADRLALSEHIVFDDLVALARFVLFPADELNLAALLKSPLCGLDDDRLYDLAHGRGRESLWDRLQRRAAERADWTQALAVLQRARAEGAARRPFEFYAGMLDHLDGGGRSLRQRLLKRLGAEAEEAIDEFLTQVLAAEGRGVHDLESLAAAFADLDITIKREMDAPTGEVRVMTAHGAKGLEAPIVFLPETTLTRTARGSPLMKTADGGFLWCGSKERDCQASAAARELRVKAEEDEALRLLYVALTRARDRLVLCGRAAAGAKPEKIEGWWGAVARALDHDDIAPHVRPTACSGMEIRRYGPDPLRLPKTASPLAPRGTSLPAWASRPAAPEAFGRYASPSDLGEGARAAAPSPLSEVSGLGRFRRGDLIHRLLQVLPDLPAADRPGAARALMARERDIDEAQRAEMAEAALAVLQDARFAEVFGSGSRAEVAIAGASARLPAGLKVSGRIDRLVVLPDRVLVADYKTNRPSPERIEDADPAYLRQMAIYVAVLEEVFPGRAVEAALIWTDGPKLMPIPEKLVAQTLAELRHAG